MKKTAFTRQKFFALIILCFHIAAVTGQIVNNGDMESWTGNTPDGWTTIDSGITTTRESTIIHGGTYSASIEVTTGSQGNTDFRQSVTLINGHDYHVSVWVYHTEGHIKARLYVDGYHNYSDNTLTGDWQEISYNYTATQDGDIELGLRFYDQAGFDGSEIVYVDDFVITDMTANAAPEMEIQGNGHEIVNGDSTPDTVDDTDFGNVEVNTFSDHTFTIFNTGNADLNLTDSPIVSISGDAAFSIQTQPASNTVAAGGSETFVVHFAPTAMGTVTATISIANNDSDENPYTFEVQGTGSYSTETDIISNANEALTVSSLVNDASINSTSDGVEVWQFTIRDGGADLSDTDTAGTTLTGMTFTQASGNAMNDWNDAILACALFDGTVKIADATSITTNQIQFSGLSVTVPDDSSKTLSLRISIQTSPNDSGSNVDGDDFQFQISNANVTADAGGSQFDSFPSAKSENGKNVFEVLATQLVFSIQPSDIGDNSTMIPAPQVAATDANGNIDLDYNGDITITSTGTMTDDPITVTATGGVADFTNVVHTVIGTGFTLTASSPGLPDVLSNTFDVLEQTVLNPGDLAILAVNTNLGNAEDQIAFVCMKDLTPGTKIYLTDNGYEREYAGEWGGTEGVISITRTNSTLPKGTIITFESTNGNVTDPSHYDIWTCGSIDTNWTKTALSGTGIGGFNLNSDDDVWIMQGGTWTNDTSHHSTYDGNVLYGWTESGWDAGVGDGTNGTKWSNLYPGSACFTTVAPAGDGKVKFNDPDDPDFSTTTNDRLDWIAEINTTGNWDTYTTNSDYNSGGFDYKGDTNCPQMTIAASTHIPGTWTGNDSSNWFDCANWDTMVVPDANTNTVIPSTALNPPVIDATATDADLYNNIAQTLDLHIQDGLWIELNNAADVLEVHGDLTVDNNAMLVMNDGDDTTDDGHLYLYGNWTNNYGDDGLDQGNGTVHLTGTSAQTVMGNAPDDTEEFYNLEINNPAGVSFTSGNIHAANNLTITASPEISISDGHYLLAGNTLDNQAGTTIDIASQASLVQTAPGADTNTGLLDGNFIIHRTTGQYTSYDYIYWSSPTDNELIGNVFAANPQAYIFRLNTANFNDLHSGSYPQTTGGSDGFDDEGDDWESMQSGDVMVPGKGYIAMGEGSPFPISNPLDTGTHTQSVIFDGGKINNGDITIPVYADADSGDAYNNQNLIGNPYPSAMDLGTFAQLNNAVLTGNFYFWTHDSAISSGNAGPDAYNFTNDDYAQLTIDVNTGTVTGDIAGSNGTHADTHVASCQGFLADVTGDGTLHFDNSVRIYDNTHFRNVKTGETDRIRLNLTKENSGIFRQIWIGFYDGAGLEYFPGQDGLRMPNGDNTDFYSLIPGDERRLAIQNLGTFSGSEIIPLGMEIVEAGTYTIGLEDTGGVFTEGQPIWLVDHLLSLWHPLHESAYEFYTDTGDNMNARFDVRFTENTAGTEDISAIAGISPNPASVFIDVYANKPVVSVSITDVTGKRLKTVLNNTGIEDSMRINIAELPAGIYFVQIRHPAGEERVKLLVNR